MTAAGGRVTLVTGASSGLGREFARLAAADGGTVVLVARREGRLEELARELEGAGREALVRPCDLTDDDQVDALLEGLAVDGVAVDHLVNNAGFGVTGRFDRIDAATERAMVELDVAAVHRLLVALLPGMVERGYGRVLNVASTAGFQPLPRMATYAAAKTFVQHHSEALWQELRGSGVSVTCLCPGKTATEFFDHAGMEGTAFEKMPMADAAAVARAGYRGMMAGKRLVVPGFQNKLNRLVSLVPRGLVLSVAGALFRRRDRGTGNAAPPTSTTGG